MQAPTKPVTSRSHSQEAISMCMSDMIQTKTATSKTATWENNTAATTTRCAVGACGGGPGDDRIHGKKTDSKTLPWSSQPPRRLPFTTTHHHPCPGVQPNCGPHFSRNGIRASRLSKQEIRISTTMQRPGEAVDLAVVHHQDPGAAGSA